MLKVSIQFDNLSSVYSLDEWTDELASNYVAMFYQDECCEMSAWKVIKRRVWCGVMSLYILKYQESKYLKKVNGDSKLASTISFSF